MHSHILRAPEIDVLFVQATGTLESLLDMILISMQMR